MTVALEMGGRSGVRRDPENDRPEPVPVERARREDEKTRTKLRSLYWWHGRWWPRVLPDVYSLQRTELWRAAWGDSNRRGEE